MPSRTFMPNMPEYTSYILYVSFGVAVIIHLYGIKILADSIGMSCRNIISELLKLISKSPRKIIKSFALVIKQKKTNEEKSGLFYHTPFLYSVLILICGTILIGIEEDLIKKILGISFIKGNFYIIFEFLLDSAGLIILAGILLLLWRRIVTKPSYLYSDITDYSILFLLLVIVLTGFLVESLRIGLDQKNIAATSFVGRFLLSFIPLNTDANVIIGWYRGFWFIHMELSMFLIAIVPFTKLKHILLIPLNIIINPPKNIEDKAKLSTPFNILEIEEDNEDDNDPLSMVGVGSTEDFDWKERVQIRSCINCGRCEKYCPAHNAGRLLSPRNVIQKINDEMVSPRKKEVLFENTISHEEMWACTQCYACIEVCPSFIRQVDHFLDFRRFIVNTDFEDEQKINILGNIDRNGNPYGLASYDRTEWLIDYKVSDVLEKEEFEYLYFIGCSSSYDNRCQQITKAIINILNYADIDFAILGDKEKCCGEPAKRMGEEGLFQMTAMENIELFESYGIKKIIVHCPHCYNMLKHEYKEFEGNYTVLHHSEMISELIDNGKIDIDNLKKYGSITYHDPCNIGRLNDIYDQPRKSLEVFGKLVEMKLNREKSFCCGGGGGNSFYKVNESKRISKIRIEEALMVRPKVLAVGCPFCLTMFEDGRGDFPKNVNIPEILDIAEIVSFGLSLEQTTHNGK